MKHIRFLIGTSDAVTCSADIGRVENHDFICTANYSLPDGGPQELCDLLEQLGIKGWNPTWVVQQCISAGQDVCCAMYCFPDGTYSLVIVPGDLAINKDLH